MRPGRVPLPPVEFAHRVGCEPGDNTMERYVALGQGMREEILGALPEDWGFEGKRILDFGCGAGRLARHFLREAREAEYFGTDMDPEMVAWLDETLCPPLAGAHVNDAAPPLRYEDSFFDLVLATSVFTHITYHWSAWLLEMHRILKPEGLMLATFLGAGAAPQLTHEPWDEDLVAMNSLGFATGAPYVLHSEWWLRAHWGRLFEIEGFWPRGFAAPRGRKGGHGFMLLRPRQGPVPTIDELERDEPGEDRYLGARRHHLRQLELEGERVREAHRQALQAARRPHEAA